MRQRTLGKSGIEASAVGLGTWAIGGWMWGGSDEKEAIRAIHEALDAGMNLIDTAPCYGLGLSEEIVGKAIGDRRDKAVVATKCGLVWHVRQGDYFFDAPDESAEGGNRQVWRYLSPASIRHEVEASLRRLRTDVIDLYQTHWQDSTTPIQETMGELLKLKDEGKIRAIGVGNASVEQLEEYSAAGQVDSDQELYSMLDRKADGVQLPFCQNHQLSFLAYSPIAQGLLTGKVGPERSFPEGDLRRDNPRFSKENRRQVIAMLEAFKPIAEAHDISLAQLAIAWTVSQPGCSHVLVGARNPDQARENARAGDVLLSDEELAVIDTAIAAHADSIV